MDIKKIVVTRTFTYDVEKVVEEWIANHGKEPTEDEIMDLIEQWVEDDMRSPLDRHSLVWMDDEGNEI